MLLFSSHAFASKGLESHSTNDFIEAYVLNRLPFGAAEIFESHLLICGACRSAVIEQQRFCDGLKQALSSHAMSVQIDASRSA